MQRLSIRAANQNDLEQLNELMYLLHDEHHQQSPEFFKTADDIEQEKSIARYLDNPECLVFVAVQEANIVGFITGHFCELVSTVSKPVQMGSIDELYVVQSHRQNGVARALCQTIEKRFEEYGVREMFVEVWDFNRPANRLYQELGFVNHINWLRKPLGR
ncbi:MULTISPECIES: GNAT family N-acetyltransferase [Vibrio]|uniref:Histone acetyltransferase n=2 Tax=Vibrio TaxID=662 RepID=A0A0A5JI81_PHOS4|nr:MULTISPECIES: GNAT family N-acetyltransferase [Vibrio]KGY07673.1 histone acetyltransferase [Vibrio sinaloensis]KHD24585.1 histone acetyltransferase [Vibrio caribbeanicus]KIE20233.1 histone acetyltransferase [Vibrio sinaloensis]